MSKTKIKINGRGVLSALTVLNLREMTDEDRAKMSENLQKDASVFNTEITFADRSNIVVRETVSELAEQVALANIGYGKYIPAVSFKGAKNLLKADKEQAIERDIPVKDSDLSGVTTTAGYQFSSGRDYQIEARVSKALLEEKERAPERKENPNVQAAAPEVANG